MKIFRAVLLVCMCLTTLMGTSMLAQTDGSTAALSQPQPLSPELTAASDLTGHYRVTPNIVYLKTGKYSARLDVYKHSGSGPKATLVYIHGGGWRGDSSKEQYSLWFEPFLVLGWNVVSVEYQTSDIAPAPAAVQDCFCALQWVVHNAEKNNFDTSRIVLMGHSAGAHLALMTGMAPPAMGFDRECPGSQPVKVAAIVDWFGIADVADLLQGPNAQTFAQKWIGNHPGQQLAKQVSPLTYVRSGVPPTIIIHGDKDPKVPYAQAVSLHAAFEKAGVPTEFITIPGGGHGGFGSEPTARAYAQIFEFLRKNGVGTEASK